MYAVEMYVAVRHFVFVEGRASREAARVFGLSRDTIDKMCQFSEPPGYQRKKPPIKPKLDPFIPVVDAILAADRDDSLTVFLEPNLTPPERGVAQVEGWILGVL